jgi:general secretion pathway protein G
MRRLGGMKRRGTGFTLLELMAALMICAILLGIAVPAYRRHIENLRVDQARSDLLRIANAIERYRTANSFRLPDSLAQLAGPPRIDPWGNAYRYLNFESPIPGIKGMIRKDHNLHPLNSEFDLYSRGADGDSKAPLTAKASQDDVIWARDGAFIGLGKDF